MGWFWASKVVPSPEAPISVVPSNMWMNEYIRNLLWAPKADIWAKPVINSLTGKCPVDHKQAEKKPSACPVDHSKWSDLAKRGGGMRSANIEQPPQQPSGCPVDHSKFQKSGGGADHAGFNHLNKMPVLHANKLPGQTIDLPTERTMSSIPRGEKPDAGFWEYPSPQQMLNAMVRKSGPDGIEEDAVESMVDVHNFLNEGVWQEVLQWEKPYTDESKVTPRLLKFEGKPGELTPKARVIQLLGKIYPSKFGVPPPFDRHNWTVLRAIPGEKDHWKQVHYVIDFYEIPDEEDDIPTFTVDVRPAIDSVENLRDRAKAAVLPTLKKALGWD